MAYLISHEYDAKENILYMSAVANDEDNIGFMKNVNVEIKTLLNADFIVNKFKQFLYNPETLSDKDRNIIQSHIKSNY